MNIKRFLLLGIIFNSVFLFADEKADELWKTLENNSCNSVSSKNYFISFFSFTPIVGDFPSTANIFSKAIDANRINTDRELTALFDKLCREYQLSEKHEKSLHNSMRNKYKILLAASVYSSFSISKLQESYEKNMEKEEQDRSRLTVGERGVLEASYYLSQWFNWGNKMSIDYLKRGVSKYCKTHQQECRFEVVDNIEHATVKAMLLRDIPVFLKSKEDHWLVICGFQEQADDVVYLIYDPEISEILKEDGKNCKIFQLKEKYCPGGDGKSLMEKFWYSQYRLYKSQKIPPCAATMSLEVMHDEGWKAVYIYDFELKKELRSDFERSFKNYLKDLD